MFVVESAWIAAEVVLGFTAGGFFGEHGIMMFLFGWAFFVLMQLMRAVALLDYVLHKDIWRGRG